MAYQYISTSLAILHISYSSALLCHKSSSFEIANDNSTNSLSSCKGDFCIRQSINIPMSDNIPGSNYSLVQYGCMSGYDVKPGCYRTDRFTSVVCHCNDKNFCNAKDNQTVITLPQVQCHEGEFENGKVIGNGTCTGYRCQLSGQVDSDKKGKMIAGCQYYDLATEFYGNGCVYVTIFDKVYGRIETWNCQCKTKFCNNPSSLKIPTKTGSTKCVLEAGNFNATTNATDVQHTDTCVGEYCAFLASPHDYTKGCLSGLVAKETWSKKKIVKLDLAQLMEIRVCDENLCNRNITLSDGHTTNPK